MADSPTFDKVIVNDKLGIGTDPIAQLHIGSSAPAPSQAFLESGGALLKLSVDGAGAAIGTDNAFPLSFQTDGSPRLSITNTGNIGIGELNPTAAKLQINGSLKLQQGSVINEFSNDATLADKSPLAVPTEQAVRTYVDTKLADKANQAGALTQDFQTRNLTVQGRLQVGNSMNVTGTIIADKVGIGTTDPRTTLHVVGQLLGAAQDTSGNALRICCGTTPQGATAWQIYTTAGIFVDVDTSACQFKETPVYIVNMHGINHHWDTTGGTCAYNITARGFRIYVKFTGGSTLTPEFANNDKWHIHWVAIGT